MWPELKLAATIWTHMIELVLQLDDVDISEIRIRMVQQAYMCIKSAQVRQLLHNAFEPNSSSKLWTILNFIARPMADCRLLQSIASREPQFQQLRISLIPPKPKTILNPVYRVEISEAWRRLGLEFTNDAEWSRVKSWNEDFEEACGKSFSLHAEMQLISHYEADPKLSTTLDYFGCSKKTCLLCEAVLQALPRSIETRGRHGVCYPAWGLPSSRSSATESAINSLERTILRHIRSVLDNPKKTRHKSFILHTPQSGVVSDFSEPTLMDWQRRKQNMELFENERTIKRNEHLAM